MSVTFFLNKRVLGTIICTILGLFAHGAGFGADERGGADLIYSFSYLEDTEGQYQVDEVGELAFTSLETSQPNFGLTSSVYWLKVHFENRSLDSIFWFNVQNPSITDIRFFSADSDNFSEQQINIHTLIRERPMNSHYPLFKIIQAPGTQAVYFVRVESKNVLELPLSIVKEKVIVGQLSLDHLLFGLYAGMILVMFFYNFFLFVTVRDVQYLYYVLYILVIGLTQACLKGFAVKYLWGGNTWLTDNGSHIITAASGVVSILFTYSFLHLRVNFRFAYRLLLVALVIYAISILIYVGGDFIVGQKILQANTSIVSLTILTSAIAIYRKGYKPALFFWIAWSFFLGGVLIYILKEAGVLSYNNFTANSILMGSGLEAALLSFALADKINIYKQEKEESQLRAIAIAKENEKLIREQNIVLEQRVAERTHALKESNESLQRTLTHLKETQAQLVEAEKMASLGQLTAGVAHEINNPINFVTSNVAPLKRDIKIVWDALQEFESIGLSDMPIDEKAKQIQTFKDEMDLEYLRTEIDFLLKGMHEGATRTAEIVKSLRIFSRVDEDALKYADINEGLESTLVILNSIVKDKIEVRKNYGDIPSIECYPGKLNQVFLNIISNGIYAINQKFGEQSTGGLLQIDTWCDDDQVYVVIEDNGIGMPDDVREKVFEPFFTTKDVGEGTGLGMSIAYNTIKKHQGEIQIESTLGIGTKFTITIPKKQQMK